MAKHDDPAAWRWLVQQSVSRGDAAEVVRRLRGSRIFIPSEQWDTWAKTTGATPEQIGVARQG